MQELLALSDEDRQTAMDRFRLLQPHLEQKRSLRLVAAEAGLAFRTAQRWVALYRTSGLASLARKTRLDDGTRRVVSEPMKRAIEGLALESHPVPITSVHRQIKEYAEAIGDIVPSYWTVYAFLHDLRDELDKFMSKLSYSLHEFRSTFVKWLPSVVYVLLYSCSRSR